MNNTGLLSCLTLSATLMACSSGSDGVPPAAPEARLDGTATDAVITNADLRVYALVDGVQSDLIAETTTDGNGDFAFDGFASPSQPIVIEVRGGRYTEEASGVSVELIDGQALRAYLFYEQGEDITVQVTPLTHLASCLADYKVASGTNVNNAITEAASVFSGIAGVDILGTRPFDITDPANANFEVTDNLRYGTFLAAISSFTAEVSTTNGVTPHRFNQNSSIYATQVLCQDISADGIFNGQGYINNGNSVGQLALGSVPLDADTFRTDIGQHILSIVSSDRNVTNLGVDDFVLYANEVAASTDAVFGGVPANAVDQEGPVSTAVLAPDSFIKGIIDLEFDVTDPIGLSSVQFEINGLFVSNTQPDNPVLSLNTTNYTDGVITVTVVAKDVLNNTSRTEFNYVVDNTSPTILMTSETLTNNRAYTATGTFEAEGAPITSITVNTVPATINASVGTWSADIMLASGNNSVDIEIIDQVGNSNTLQAMVSVDLIRPTITPLDTQVDYTTYQGQLNLCNTGQLTPTSGNDNPVCLSTDNVALNGATLTGNIQYDGYVLLGFSPTDPQGAGVFTEQNDLIVEYMYEVNGVEHVPWTTAPIAASSLIYYFPMVTEYLGAGWFQTTTSDVHQVTIRVTDNAGNSSLLPYQLRFDVLIPDIAISTTVDDVIFSASFAGRTAVDGSIVNINYSFDNPSQTAYLISLSDPEGHDVLHTYESGVRQNRARARVQENWYAYDCNPSAPGSTAKHLATCAGTPNIRVTSVQFQHDVNSNIHITPRTQYSGYQDVFADAVNVNQLTGVPAITPLAQFNCHVGRFDDAWYIGAYANGNASFGVCAFYRDSDDGQRGVLTSITGSVASDVQYQVGYPRNVITTTDVGYDMFTESISVTNDTLGRSVLPVNGWYSVPPNSSITITKSVRSPILTRYQDNELANHGTFGSYTQKLLDLATEWVIDTDLDVTRAIDPGDIHQLPFVTQFTETIGQGLLHYRIAR